jgi:hypothetical protein
MNDFAQFQKPMKVQSIEVLPDNRGIEISIGTAGKTPFRFRTRRFGIGRRGARSAALARFAAQAGYGDVEVVFHYVSSLPRDLVGSVFPLGPLGIQTDLSAAPKLRCVSADD